jgi:hypothetical protein
MRTLVVALLIAAAAAAFAEDEVKLTYDSDEVEFCKPVGEVKAKSGVGGSQGKEIGIRRVEAALRKQAVERGGNVVLMGGIEAGFTTSGKGQAFACSDEAFAKQKEKSLEVAKKASAPITCTAGTDCEVRWSRVTLWLLDHSDWKFRDVTDTLITTEGPMDTMAKPAWQVTKVPTGDGKTYRIAIRGYCGQGDCEKLITVMKAKFYDALTAPIETPPAQ